MNKFVRTSLMILNFIAISIGAYAYVSPAGSWMPRYPNWSDFWDILMLAIIGCVIHWHLMDKSPKAPDDPKPPKGGRFA